MLEWLIEYWAEVCFGLLIVGFLMMIIFVNMCYEEQKRKYEEENKIDEFADLRKMMPKLPKEKKRNDR